MFLSRSCILEHIASGFLFVPHAFFYFVTSSRYILLFLLNKHKKSLTPFHCVSETKESDERNLNPPQNSFYIKTMTSQNKKLESPSNMFQNTRTRHKERGILCWRLLLALIVFYDSITKYRTCTWSWFSRMNLLCIFNQHGCCAPERWSKSIKNASVHQHFFEFQLILLKFHRN